MKKLSNSPTRMYSIARWAILAVILFTAINCILYLIGSEDHYICSIFLAYYLFDADVVSIFLTLLIIAPYVLAYIFSKKKGGWMIAAAVLFLIDTVIVAILFIAAFDYLSGIEIWNGIIELLTHIVVDVLLILGIKHRKVGTMSDEEMLAANTTAGAVAAQVEGRSAEVGHGPEIECSVSVSGNGKPNGLATQGVIRFENEELVVGAQSMAATMLVGSLLASMKEVARFSYGSIVSLEYTNKRQTAVRLDLSDGRIVCFVFSAKAMERFRSLMETKGVELPPRMV